MMAAALLTRLFATVVTSVAVVALVAVTVIVASPLRDNENNYQMIAK